jgi:predicted RNase H-like HicB family nuclease
MSEIIFQVLQDEIDGGYSASALGFGVHTEAETLDELRLNIREAVSCHFDNSHEIPKLVRLYFVHDEVFAMPYRKLTF